MAETFFQQVKPKTFIQMENMCQHGPGAPFPRRIKQSQPEILPIFLRLAKITILQYYNALSLGP